MTKRPGSGTGRFGDGPQGAPLPLVTQAMAPLDDPGATRIDNPLARIVDPALVGVRADAAPTVFGKVTAMASPQPKLISPAGPPPEIGLTQHALPADERPDPRLVLMLDPDSERAAAFRVLRHHLLEVGRPQVIIVSSARPGDGKTTTALNLALALAECGRAKVLLAEAHMRRPQLANIFKCIPPWCFAEQLAAHRHQPMLPWSLVEIPQVWLHIAPVSPRLEKTQLLDAPAFAIAIDRLRLAGYDHIVIDAPPVLGSADVNLMADAADAVLLAVRARHSTSRDLRKAIDQIGASKVVGTVIVE
ncbi:MAG: ATPase involved in chromosome partitioning-like protein [Myxococcales bacterium]|nr:ATPase involved in chromosome partitioning-like protein [Myxococcales bacterium]